MSTHQCEAVDQILAAAAEWSAGRSPGWDLRDAIAAALKQAYRDGWNQATEVARTGIRYEQGMASGGHPMSDWQQRAAEDLARLFVARFPDYERWDWLDVAKTAVEGEQRVVQRVEALAEEWAKRCPPDDWPSPGGMEEAVIADCGRAVLAALAEVTTTPQDATLPHEVVVEVYDGIAIGMRCVTPSCRQRIEVRPESAAASLTELNRLATEHGAA